MKHMGCSNGLSSHQALNVGSIWRRRFKRCYVWNAETTEERSSSLSFNRQQTMTKTKRDWVATGNLKICLLTGGKPLRKRKENGWPVRFQLEFPSNQAISNPISQTAKQPIRSYSFNLTSLCYTLLIVSICCSYVLQ